MKRLLTILLLLVIGSATAANRPKLVVQIVIGSMRAGDIARYEANYSDGGFRRLTEQGAHFTEACYDFQQTLTPTTLSTLSTGSMPSMHGIVGDSWQDYTTNERIDLIDGERGPGGYHLIAPTLAETLRKHQPKAHTTSIAIDPTGAILLGGRSGDIYWVDPASAEWVTSLYYTNETPLWLARMNREGFNLSYLLPVWAQQLNKERYINTRHHDIRLRIDDRRSQPVTTPHRISPRSEIERLRYTPAGNSAVLGFAKQCIAQQQLGQDEVPDLLNIYLDTPRYLTELYGPASIEVEDMYYRLDRDLEDFLTFLYAQVSQQECLVVLTSDHGTADAYDPQEKNPIERFNPRQFRVIANGFLNVRYGSGRWVLDYRNHALYLNHTLIYERNLNLAQLQNEIAIFAMQFSGVSHALSANALRSSYFADGYARRIQNSFYARRSGDVLLNLMPGWFEEQEGIYSASGSMYGYDTEVDLYLVGCGIPVSAHSRKIDMTAVAPTLAHLMGIPDPDASEGSPLEEIIQQP